MTIRVNAAPEHSPLSINAIIDHEKIVVFRIVMFVDKMTSPLLPVDANLVAVFQEASEGLVTSFALDGDDRVMVLA